MGRAIALKLASSGVSVYLLGRTQSKLENVASEIRAQGHTAFVVTLDVTQSSQIDPFAQGLDRADMLINCAGEAFLATMQETSDDDWDRILAVNLKSSFLMTRALLPLLLKSPNASIVNMVSKVALKAYHPVAAYTAAKAGLLGFTRSLQAELVEQEVRVVALCPGPVDTPMRWESTPDFDRKVVISTETVADMVWHLVSLPRGTTVGEVLLQSMHYD
jgi:NAD(P)-dependent dehydrogenase (short-subunit alcohol dehydrogenase family)